MTQQREAEASRRSSKRPGQMTAAMRAGVGASAARLGPKVLRIGVVHDGRVREERTFGSNASVSVGSREDNSFLLGGGTYPASFRLFERIDEVYHLNFTEGMQGRVVLASGLFELSELRARALRVPGGAHRIALSEESRGRVVLGDVTFLFHFVEPSPSLPKAVLPAAVLRGRSSIDWNSTICAAVSFFLHFTVLGAVYSDWADPVIDDDVRAAGLVDALKNLPPPPPIEIKAAPDEAPTISPDPPISPTKTSRPAPAKNAPGLEGGPSAGRARDATLSDQLEQIDTSILGALASEQPATSAVLRRSEVAWNALDAAAASKAGVGSGTGSLLPSGGAPIRPGTTGSIRDVGTTTLGPDGPGQRVTVSGPSAVANVAPPSTMGGMVSNAARVVAGMRARFRACYQRGLAENPDAGGSVRLTIRVGPGGEVLSVTASPSGNLPATVVSCVQARAQAAQFDPPEGGSAVISVPVTFVKQ